jgi:hypothetical protein
MGARRAARAVTGRARDRVVPVLGAATDGLPTRVRWRRENMWRGRSRTGAGRREILVGKKSLQPYYNECVWSLIV